MNINKKKPDRRKSITDLEDKYWDGPCQDELPGCCGVQVIYDVGFPSDVTLALLKPQLELNLVIFADNVRAGNGVRLAAYIRRHKLGLVQASKPVRNPNHGSIIQAWMWHVNHSAYDKWFDKHFKD